MLATLVDAPFDDADWVFETKWDGYRLIANCRGAAGVTLLSRNQIDVTDHYPTIATALGKLRRKAVIDGEIVALDRSGRSQFQLLQNARSGEARLRFCVFDLLFLNGKDLRREELLQRKDELRRILPSSPLLHFSGHAPTHGKKLFAIAKRSKLEGIMAKRSAGLYYSGRRTREWLKIKASKQQEAVIVGFTAPRGSRRWFGSLVLGLYEGGKLVYAGHVGTGFDHATLRALHQKMSKRATDEPPFAHRVRFDSDTTWLRPVLVCELRFTEWTKGGEMRHPSFLGLRTDKSPKEVVRETA